MEINRVVISCVPTLTREHACSLLSALVMFRMHKKRAKRKNMKRHFEGLHPKTPKSLKLLRDSHLFPIRHRKPQYSQ